MTLDQSELDPLRDWISNKVRLYVGDDGSSREEITQAVITDYWNYTKENDVEITSNGIDDTQPTELSISVRSLAHRILKRRVADYYRKHVAHSAVEVSSDQWPEVEFASADPTHFRILLNEAILLETVHWMTRQSTTERDLLLRDVSPDSSSDALTPAERKQLSRLRRRLSTWIETKFEEPLKALLNDY